MLKPPSGPGENCFAFLGSEICTVEPNPETIESIGDLLDSLPIPPPPT